MLTLYKAPKSESSSSSSSNESIASRRIIPKGTPYLTKVNGKLVMAREKRESTADIALDLLHEAFGPKTRIIRRRSRSLEREKGPLFINGVPYVPQGPPAPITYSAPIPQQGFQPVPLPQMLQHAQQYSQQYPVPYYPGLTPSPIMPAPKPEQEKQPKPTKADFANLVEMDTHFKKIVEDALKASKPSIEPKENEEVVETKTTITITKHICAHCGRLRSRKYHHEHPIKEGETPAAGFCRKCQKDASSTSEESSSDSEREERKKKREKMKKSAKYKTKEKKTVVEEMSSDEEPPVSKERHGKKPKPSRAKKEEPHFDPKEDYIVVEEEFSEEEPRPRGRRREKAVPKEFDGRSRPQSPDSRAFPRRAHSAADRQDRERVREATYAADKRNRDRRRAAEHAANSQAKYHRPQSPSADFSRDEPSASYYGDAGADWEEAINPTGSSLVSNVKHDDPAPPSREYRKENKTKPTRKIPVRYVEVVEEPIFVPSKGHAKHRSETYRRADEYTVEEPESVSARSHGRHPDFDERSTSTGGHQDWDTRHDHSSVRSRSPEIRRRRRRERVVPDAYDEYQRDEDNRYEPRRSTQEYVDRSTLDAHQESRRFAPDDAARYFAEDWGYDKRPESQPARGRQSYRRDRQPSTSSLSSYGYAANKGTTPPRAPSPPSLLDDFPHNHHQKARRNDTEPPRTFDYRHVRGAQHSHVHERARSTSTARAGRDWDRSSHRSEASERARSNSTAHSGRERQRSPEGRQRARSNSAARYARSRHNSPEEPFTPEPPQPRSRYVGRSEGSILVPEPERTEREIWAEKMAEKMTELGMRHVSFRDTPSERSAPAWPSGASTPTNQAQTKHTRSGSDVGWNPGGTTARPPTKNGKSEIDPDWDTDQAADQAPKKDTDFESNLPWGADGANDQRDINGGFDDLDQFVDDVLRESYERDEESALGKNAIKTDNNTLRKDRTHIRFPSNDNWDGIDFTKMDCNPPKGRDWW